MSRYDDRAPTDTTGWEFEPAPPSVVPGVFDKPDAKRFEKAETYWVHLEDECPRIGSGHRRVWATIGRKWVYLCGAYDTRGRVTLDMWKEIVEDE